MPSLNSDKIIEDIDNIKESIIESEIKKILEKDYNIIVEKIEKNEESTDGNVYIVYTQSEKYVIKKYKTIEHTKTMIELHKRLYKIGLNIPKIIENTNDKGYAEILNSSYIVVYSFLEGNHIGWDKETGKLNNKTVSLIAKELRKFHENTRNNVFGLKEVPFKNNLNNKSALHFDLTRGNIFIENDKIGFIDFDDAKYGDSLCDVAILIANLFFSKTRGVDLEGAYRFINEYYGENIELKDTEIALIKEYALNWIKYILDGNEFDTSTTESFEVRSKLIEENL